MSITFSCTFVQIFTFLSHRYVVGWAWISSIASVIIGIEIWVQIVRIACLERGHICFVVLLVFVAHLFQLRVGCLWAERIVCAEWAGVDWIGEEAYRWHVRSVRVFITEARVFVLGVLAQFLIQIARLKQVQKPPPRRIGTVQQLPCGPSPRWSRSTGSAGFDGGHLLAKTHVDFFVTQFVLERVQLVVNNLPLRIIGILALLLTNIRRVRTVTRTYETRPIILIAERIQTDENILGQLIFNVEKLEIVVGRQTPGLINCREVVLEKFNYA